MDKLLKLTEKLNEIMDKEKNRRADTDSWEEENIQLRIEINKLKSDLEFNSKKSERELNDLIKQNQNLLEKS